MEQFLIVCPLVFLAGFVDSIAGGGGLISFPAYMLAGVPVHVILGTSKLSAFPGSIVAALRFAKSGYIRFKLALSACGPGAWEEPAWPLRPMKS
ncbi:MAG: sulfite exporter TauE/SafE family protein [Enterocloster sp.]